MSGILNTIKAQYGGRKALLHYYRYRMLHFCGRSFGASALEPEKVSRLVFVCKGNICRSVYAEVIARKISDLPVASFGLDTSDGKPANERVSARAKQEGLDLSTHKTTTFGSFKSEEGDLFVCMEPEQCLALRSLKPDAHIILLGLIGSPKIPYIHDPFNSGDEYLEQCMKLISDRVHVLVSAVTATQEAVHE